MNIFLEQIIWILESEKAHISNDGVEGIFGQMTFAYQLTSNKGYIFLNHYISIKMLKVLVDRCILGVNHLDF